jgi:tetratricopeptide (TPR) repeat protein
MRTRFWFWLAVLAAFGLLAAMAPIPLANAAEDPLELIERGKWRQAKALVEPRLAANANDAEALWMMARIRVAYGDDKGALELAEKAVALDPNDARFHEALSLVLGQKAQNAGPVSQMRLAGKFKKEADRAVALDPRRYEAQNALLMFFLKAPGIAGGSKEKARAKADEILALDPVEGQLAHATLALEMKDTTAALDRYRKAVAAGPNSYDARISLARGLTFGDKTLTEAETHAVEARRIDPGRTGAWSLLAGLYAHARRWPELDALLVQAREALGHRTVEYSAARQMVVDRSDAQRAEKLLREYLAVEPEPGAPKKAHAHWRLGLALEQQNRGGEAVAELEAALKLDPELDPAKKDLKRMRKQS